VVRVATFVALSGMESGVEEAPSRLLYFQRILISAVFWKKKEKKVASILLYRGIKHSK